jgi:hypothetical protein
MKAPVQEVLEDAICHICQRFGIDFSHEYQSGVDKKIVLVLYFGNVLCFGIKGEKY